MRKEYGFTVILFLIVAINILGSIEAYSQTGGGASDSGLWERWLDDYARVYKLRSKGVDTGKLEEKLLTVYLAIKKNETGSSIERMLDQLEHNISITERNADRIVTYAIIGKAVEAGLILSFPVLFYLGFPRIYIQVFFKTRRKWVVEDEPAG